MKSFLSGMLLLIASAASATTPPSNATVFPQIDDSTNGWGSCTDPACSGGTASASVYWMQQNQTAPSLDGASTQFYVDGPAGSNVLFWNKLGAHDSLTHFQSDFWVHLDSNSTIIGQAFEFDTFQFVNGREYMFGTQCDYANGLWEVWNAQSGAWQNTGVRCPKFTPNVWYHITWNYHRGARLSNSKNQYYDNFKVVQYDANNNVVASHSYSLNLVYGSAPLPSGWNDNMGVQFQMDLNSQAGVNSNPTTISEYVDKVTLTAW
jgi:hypothetical protein